jgi:hypothetical protein
MRRPWWSFIIHYQARAPVGIGARTNNTNVPALALFLPKITIITFTETPTSNRGCHHFGTHFLAHSAAAHSRQRRASELICEPCTTLRLFLQFHEVRTRSTTAIYSATRSRRPKTSSPVQSVIPPRYTLQKEPPQLLRTSKTKVRTQRRQATSRMSQPVLPGMILPPARMAALQAPLRGSSTWTTSCTPGLTTHATVYVPGRNADTADGVWRTSTPICTRPSMVMVSEIVIRWVNVTEVQLLCSVSKISGRGSGNGDGVCYYEDN